MSNFYYVAVGAVVAVSLVWVFFLLKDQWEERKEAQKRRMTRIAEDVYNERSKRTAEYVRLLAMEVIYHRLAEKEGGE